MDPADNLLARYSYLADGTKLEVSDALGGGYLYFGSLIYHKLGDRYEPESVGFSGGRIVGTSTGSQVRYHVTDYLGSVRVVADADGKRLEKCDYYPFGKRIAEVGQPLASNRYLFNGKEWQAVGGVNLLDYGARMYDPNLGRWLKQDPIYQMQNPYNFCASDPVNKCDPNGMMIDWVQDNDTGEITWNDGALSRDTTPPGYTYLGSSIEDILNALGIFLHPAKYYGNKDFYGRVTEGKEGNSNIHISAYGTISICPDIKYFPYNISPTNRCGITFNGIRIEGSFVYEYFSTTGSSINGDAFLSFFYGGKLYRTQLTPSTSYFSAGGVVLDGSILVPAAIISPSNVFSEATIIFPFNAINGSGSMVPVTRGFLGLFPVKPISFSWKFQNPVIYSKNY